LRSAVAEPEAARAPGVYAEGILAGLVGAATIAVWFLALDSIKGPDAAVPGTPRLAAQVWLKGRHL
jgi:hypothetical protein